MRSSSTWYSYSSSTRVHILSTRSCTSTRLLSTRTCTRTVTLSTRIHGTSRPTSLEPYWFPFFFMFPRTFPTTTVAESGAGAASRGRIAPRRLCFFRPRGRPSSTWRQVINWPPVAVGKLLLSPVQSVRSDWLKKRFFHFLLYTYKQFNWEN